MEVNVLRVCINIPIQFVSMSVTHTNHGRTTTKSLLHRYSHVLPSYPVLT